MKQGKLKRRLRRTVRKVISGGITRLVKPAAVEQSNEQTISADEEGLLRLKTEALRLPSALAEASEEGESSQHWLMPGRVMLTITAAAIAFIAIITWFISQMPEK